MRLRQNSYTVEINITYEAMAENALYLDMEDKIRFTELFIISQEEAKKLIKSLQKKHNLLDNCDIDDGK